MEMGKTPVERVIMRTAGRLYTANKSRLQGLQLKAFTYLVVWQGYADAYDAGQVSGDRLATARAHLSVLSPELVESAARDYWRQSGDLQAEFANASHYAAFVAGVLAERIRIYRGRPLTSETKGNT